MEFFRPVCYFYQRLSVLSIRDRLIILLIWKKAKNDGLIVVEAIYNGTLEFDFEPENTSTHLFRHNLTMLILKCLIDSDWNIATPSF